ncbi:MAG TPA: DUF4230 domain-containing protein [Chthoniobacterales bacterium]|nr:DUF4230 domain-containing protein [Chthoniobacterales bacterium]
MSNDEGMPGPEKQASTVCASSLIRHSLFVLRHDASGRISWPTAVTVVAALIAAVVLLIFWRLETWPGRTVRQGSQELERLGRELRSAFVDIAHLQPRIKINDRVYLEQTIPTSELVVLSQRVEVEHELQHTWAGSSKRVKLHGTFLVKAGFDLRQELSINIRPDVVLVRVPHGQILGVEQQQVDVLEFENGYWNRISAEDMQSQLEILPQLARRKAEDAGLATAAETSLQQQLEARIHPAQPLQITFVGAAAKD